MKRTFITCLILSSLLGSYTAQALPPTAEEMTAATQWAAAKFDGIEPNVQPNELKVGIQVLQNHDPLQKNTRGGAPLEIGSVKETRRVLLGHLTGFAAFRTADKMQEHRERYAAKRQRKREASQIQEQGVTQDE